MKDKKMIVKGQKGSSESTPYVPVEAENSLQANSYANIVDLLCEGEIGGPANLSEWAKSIYLNEIPIQNPDNSFNYSGVTVEGRIGTSTQTHLEGFDTIENTTSVNTAVTIAGGAVSRTITDTDVDDCKVTISIPTLLEQVDNGDLNKTTVQLEISVTPDNGAGSEQVVIDRDAKGKIHGKCISEYRKQYVLKKLSQYGSAPWVIKVTRITADSGSAKLVNAFKWYSYTSVIQTKLRYYDRAVVGLRIDGNAFGNQVPTRAYKVNGRKIQIPDNYDPDSRVYTGDWTGTFTTGVTNNPAWIIYDLLTDPDIGLGNIIEADMVDKWSLYTAGQYCDETITVSTRTKQSDGTFTDSSSSEHRFSFNGVVENRNQALQVITHFSSVMRAYPIWSAGQISFVQDKPITSPARPVGLSNVSEAGFEYSGIPKRDRHSVVKVSWNDPEKLGKLAVEEIVDEDSIINFGYNELDFVAFGCNSRTEAIRRGNYVLDTDINAREVVKFKGGLEWADAVPGTLLSIQDPNYALTILEGRVKSYPTTESLVLDKEIVFEGGKTYTMLLQTATSDAEEKTLTNGAGTTDTLIWSGALTDNLIGAQLVISVNDLTTRQFLLVTNIEEEGFYNIMGVEYDPAKYARIEDGIIGENPVSTALLASKLEPPTNLIIEGYTYTEGDQDIRKYGMQISWVHSTDPRVDKYELRYRPSSGGWIYLGETVENSYDWKDVIGDTYDIGVRGVGVGIESEWLTYTDFVLADALDNLAPPTNLDTADGSGIWSGRDCEIVWDPSAGSEYSSTYDDDVGDSNVDHYTVVVMDDDTTLLRTVDTSVDAVSYIYTYAMNVDDHDGVPTRNLLFYVYAVDVYGISSTSYASTTADNPIPDMSSTTPTGTARYGYIRAEWTLTNDNDMYYYKIYCDTSNPPTTDIGDVNHPINTYDIQGLDVDTSYRIQIEPYDLFGVGTKSVVSSPINPLIIPDINIDVELQDSITITDTEGTSESNLLKLYNSDRSTNGVSYTGGSNKYIQYAYNIENYFDRIGIWTNNGNANVYIGYSTDGSTWNYLKAEGDHTTDSDNRLLVASNESDAQTNYWDMTKTGLNIALFPNNISATHIRIYLYNSWTTTFYELVPSRIIISELAAIEHLSSISGDIGTIITGEIISSNYPTSGLNINVDDGTIVGAVTFKANTTGYSNIDDSPNDLGDINTTEGNKLTGIATGADVTGSNTANNANNYTGNTISESYTAATDNSDWEHTSDTTKIDGGKIYTNTIVASAITTNTLSAISANLGSVVINSTGFLKTIGKDTYWDNTAGIYLGWDGGLSTYGINIGDSSNYLKWNGSSLLVGGNIIATGNINVNAITNSVSSASSSVAITTLGGKTLAGFSCQITMNLNDTIGSGTVTISNGSDSASLQYSQYGNQGDSIKIPVAGFVTRSASSSTKTYTVSKSGDGTISNNFTWAMETKR